MSKSLGTLTLDLVARTGGFVQGMDKAERSSAKWRKQVEKDMKVVKDRTVSALKVGAASATAFAVATAALTKKGMEAVESQARFAKSLGTTYDSVTQLRAAFGDSGIDDFEASMNRLNRRLGAAELGRGAAVNAVKELKLDLQELAQVDAAERVAIIADRIKDVATNSQTAARYAQDLGFEQREAASFFLQGGDAVRAYSEKVEALGLSLSDIDAQKVIDAQNAMGAFGDITTAVSQKLAVEFAPVLTGVSNLILEMAKDAGGMGDAIADALDMGVSAAGFAADAIEGVRRVFLLLGSTAAITFLKIEKSALEAANTVGGGSNSITGRIVSSLPVVKEFSQALQLSKVAGFSGDIKAELDTVTAALEIGIADIDALMLKPMPSATLKRFVREAKVAAQKAAEEAAKTLDDYAPGVSGLGETEKKEDNGYEDKLKAYKALVKELRTEEEKLTEQLKDRLEVLDAVSEASVDDYQRAIAAATTDAPTYAGLAPEVGGAFGELAKVDEAEEELQEWYETQLGMLAEFRKERADLTSQWDDEELRLQKEYNNRLLSIEQARQMAQLAAGEEYFGNMAEITRAFFGESSGLYKAAFAMEKSYAIAKALINAPKSYSDAYAAVVGIPYVGPVLAPAAGAVAAAAQVAQASAIGSIQMTGMAHDGIDSVPETGTWLLEKGERVITADTSAKLDSTLSRMDNDKSGGGVVVNLIEDSSKAGQVQQSQGQDRKQIIDIFVADIMGDGRSAGAIQGKWGLAPQGR